VAPIVRRGSRGGARVATTRHRPHVALLRTWGLACRAVTGSVVDDRRPVPKGTQVLARLARLDRGIASAARALGTGLVAGAVITVVGSGTAFAASSSPSPAASATSPTLGLYGAQDPKFDGVYRQSLAVIGLVATGHQPDANAVGWLLAQQCADGAFTAYRASVATPCTAAAEDENATAAAIQALAALGKPTATAVSALRHFQLADGGFYDNTAFGPAASDANSTGLALSALVAAGIDPATVASSAGKTGSDYLRSLQISCAATSGAGAFDFQGEATLHANDYATVQALLGELGKALPVAAATGGGSAPGCPASVTDAATSAAAATSYLAARLTTTNGAIPSAFGSGTDWTTTANAVLDLEAAGVGGTPVTAGLAALEANVKAYAQTAGAYVAGPLATLLVVAHASGIDSAGFGGVDLAAVLAATERTAVAAAPTPSPSAAPTAAGPTLPATGAHAVWPMTATGAMLLGLGIAALLASRRRTGSHQG
jgi:LPXTG-motif cell wall-anchored protein